MSEQLQYSTQEHNGSFSSYNTTHNMKPIQQIPHKFTLLCSQNRHSSWPECELFKWYYYLCNLQTTCKKIVTIVISVKQFLSRLLTLSQIVHCKHIYPSIVTQYCTILLQRKYCIVQYKINVIQYVLYIWQQRNMN